jgi:NTP pyrophosphatase (non-canonical NTP hydrolase)
MVTLPEIWEQQKQYNERIFQIQKRSSAEWMQTYLLGLVSESGELLEEMRWKNHRLETKEEFGPNVPEELVDLTKYIFSMWLLMGKTTEEMLDLTYAKGQYMEFLLTQEQAPLLPNVVVFDIDDVLADTRSAILTSLAQRFKPINTEIHIDLEHLLRFDAYREQKSIFEMQGGYAAIQPLYPIALLFNELRLQEYSIVCYTARPVQVFKRIRKDTFNWFKQFNVLPDKILFGREERITYCAQLKAQGKQVVLVEDDPTLARRAKLNEIKTVVPNRGYNQIVANFPQSGTWEELILCIQQS